jgi:hypothetical protein
MKLTFGKFDRKLRELRDRPSSVYSLIEQESAIIAFIERGYTDGNFVTQRDILNFVEFQFGKCLAYGRVHCFLARNASRVCQSTVSPQEQTRLHIPQPSRDQYLALIQEWMPLVPAELMFNIDEYRFSDWEERKPKLVLTSCNVKNTILPYPIHRRIRHQTLICCITAAGHVYCPLLISAEQSVRQISETGVRDGIDLKVEITSSPYVAQAVFNNYIDEVLISTVISNRSLAGREKTAHSLLR